MDGRDLLSLNWDLQEIDEKLRRASRLALRYSRYSANRGAEPRWNGPGEPEAEGWTPMVALHRTLDEARAAIAAARTPNIEKAVAEQRAWEAERERACPAS